MPLIVSHGLGKSGSTFLFQVALAAAAHANGVEQGKLRKEFFPESVNLSNYAPQPTDEIIDTIEQYLPEGKYYVLKTHGEITPKIHSRLQDRTLKALISFRDPRDCAIAMRDAGAKDRATGNDRFFSTLENLNDTLKHVKFGWSGVRKWAKCDEVLKIPYYLTSTDQNRAVQLICNHIGLGRFTNSVQMKFSGEGKSKIGEFNQGIPDRFLDAMSTAELIGTTAHFEEEIAEVDSLTERWMTEFGLRETYDVLHARREERMHEILTSLPA